MAGAKKTGKSRPRTVRLYPDDEKWVDAQPHPQGFSGVVGEAVRFFREHKDAQYQHECNTILEAVT